MWSACAGNLQLLHKCILKLEWAPAAGVQEGGYWEAGREECQLIGSFDSEPDGSISLRLREPPGLQHSRLSL